VTRLLGLPHVVQPNESKSKQQSSIKKTEEAIFRITHLFIKLLKSLKKRRAKKHSLKLLKVLFQLRLKEQLSQTIQVHNQATFRTSRMSRIVSSKVA
jgi:hypothetical protein